MLPRATACTRCQSMGISQGDLAAATLASRAAARPGTACSPLVTQPLFASENHRYIVTSEPPPSGAALHALWPRAPKQAQSQLHPLRGCINARPSTHPTSNAGFASGSMRTNHCSRTRGSTISPPRWLRGTRICARARGGEGQAASRWGPAHGADGPGTAPGRGRKPRAALHASGGFRHRGPHAAASGLQIRVKGRPNLYWRGKVRPVRASNETTPAQPAARCARHLPGKAPA